MMSYIARSPHSSYALKMSSLTASGARQTWKAFGDKYKKELPIPTFIFYYNHYMCGADIAD